MVIVNLTSVPPYSTRDSNGLERELQDWEATADDANALQQPRFATGDEEEYEYVYIP